MRANLSKFLGRALSSTLLDRAVIAWVSWIWRTKLGALGEGSRIRRYVMIHSPRLVRIGRQVSVGEFVHVWGAGGVTIGDRVLIAPHVSITSQTHPVELHRRRENVSAPVVVEDDVWIGANAVVLPGVRIGRGTVIGAGAVVTEDIAPMSVAVGVPARSRRRIVS